jgi:SAM-dependent methyltransferase
VRADFYSEYYALEDRHWWFVGRRRIFLSLLERELEQRAADGRRALDVGCGTGTMLQHLSRYARVQGIDADPKAVAFCHERGLTDVSQIESPVLPFPDGSFDLVTAFDVLEHVEDDIGLLREMYRVASPGALLLVSVPAYQFLWGAQDEISHHHRRYVAPELRRRVTAAGFQLDRVSYFNTLLFPAIAALRVGRRLLPSRGSDEVKSDFGLTPPGLVNRVLARLFGMEAALLQRVNLPVGVSVLALARRPHA